MSQQPPEPRPWWMPPGPEDGREDRPAGPTRASGSEAGRPDEPVASGGPRSTNGVEPSHGSGRDFDPWRPPSGRPAGAETPGEVRSWAGDAGYGDAPADALHPSAAPRYDDAGQLPWLDDPPHGAGPEVLESPRTSGLGWPGERPGAGGLGVAGNGSAPDGPHGPAGWLGPGGSDHPPGSVAPLRDGAPPLLLRLRPPLLVGVLLVLVVLGGVLGGGIGAWWATSRPSAAPVVTLNTAPAPSRSAAPGTVAEVAARILPSVVSVNVTTSGGGDTGSGFVIAADGYILTNNHVVEAAVGGAGRIEVDLADGRSVSASIIGRSQDYDLAVIKVSLTGLPAVTLGDSTSVAVGDPVVAVGSPLGLSGTVTSGIISAENRPVIAGQSSSSQSYINALQTDAAINPGNSGGPLVDLAGHVIGVNSAIATLSSQSPFGASESGSIGLGFAIPINQARDVAEQLIKTGEVRYPVMGVLVDQSYTGNGAKIVDAGGASTPSVVPGGPADKAGLQAGDIIVAVDGRVITSGPELIVAIRTHRPGDTIEVTYLRGSASRRTTKVTLGSAVERLSN